MAGGGPVRARQHRQHTRHRRSLRGIDARYRGMGMGSANEGGMGNGLVEGDVLDKPAAPPEEALVLPAQDRLTDVHGPLPARAALPGGRPRICVTLARNNISTGHGGNRGPDPARVAVSLACPLRAFGQPPQTWSCRLS